MAAVFSNNVEQTEALGARLGAELRPGDVVLLTGELGAGKTQFVKGMARALGVAEDVTSPTFNLMVEYRGEGGAGGAAGAAGGALLRHFDLYRLDSADELDDIDYFGLLETDGAISLVEWGDKFPDALPLHYRVVTIEVIDETTRAISGLDAPSPTIPPLPPVILSGAALAAQSKDPAGDLQDDCGCRPETPVATDAPCRG